MVIRLKMLWSMKPLTILPMGVLITIQSVLFLYVNAKSLLVYLIRQELTVLFNKYLNWQEFIKITYKPSRKMGT